MGRKSVFEIGSHCVVWICLSLLAKVMEGFFVYLLPISLIGLKKGTKFISARAEFFCFNQELSGSHCVSFYVVTSVIQGHFPVISRSHGIMDL